MGLFRKETEKTETALAVQTSSQSKSPFWQLNSYVPMALNNRVYKALRESVPIIDAAIEKIIRLVMGFHIETGQERLDEDIKVFLDDINVGGNMRGITAFLDTYMSELLTYGSAIGEIVCDDNRIYALYNGESDAIEVKRSNNLLDIEFYNSGVPIENPEKILFFRYQSSTGGNTRHKFFKRTALYIQNLGGDLQHHRREF